MERIANNITDFRQNMWNKIKRRRVSVLVATISWILLLTVEIREHDAITSGTSTPVYLKGLLLNIFTISLYTISLADIQKKELDFRKMLWHLFTVTFACTGFSIIANIISAIFIDSQQLHHHPFWYTILFHIEFSALTYLLVTAYITWKEMILFERSPFAQKAWRIFEVFLIITLLSHFFRIGITKDIIFNASYTFSVLWTLILCVNVKWIPLLNFRQKITAITQIILVLLSLGYFGLSFEFYFKHEPFGSDDFLKNIFIISLLTFVIVYGITAVLFMLFNLPTSSIFDKKIAEMAIFRKLSDVISNQSSERDIYKILFDSAIEASHANAGWLETTNGKLFFADEIPIKEAQQLRANLAKAGYDGRLPKSINYNPYFGKGKKQKYHSILLTPVYSDDKLLAQLFLLHEEDNAFDKMMMSTITTYVNQAGMALYNRELVAEIIEGEVWKKNLEIAKKVQERLIPKRWESEGDMEMIAISESAVQVGGDYYDYHTKHDGHYAMIIADVAGKGINAAFNMAQMKGIFQTLVKMNLSPIELIVQANKALVGCLEKTAFITATYYHIDTQQKTIDFARAGHCPTLYYSKSKGKAFYFENKGLGLGIVRNDSYKNFIKPQQWHYETEDVMMLYTDGIVEAQRKDDKEQFGYERLKDFLDRNHQKTVKEMSKSLFDEIYNFLGESQLQDDFTLIIVKF